MQIFVLFLVTNCLAYNFSLFQEPVQDENDIIRFCEESGLPVALDETIDNLQENAVEKLAKYAHPGIVAVVSDSAYSYFNLVLGVGFILLNGDVVKLQYLCSFTSCMSTYNAERINGNSTEIGVKLTMAHYLCILFMMGPALAPGCPQCKSIFIYYKHYHQLTINRQEKIIRSAKGTSTVKQVISFYADRCFL